MKKYTKEELKQILDAHREWLGGNGGNRAYLRGADLREAYLRGADLREAYLREASLRGADLREADLREASLLGADLRGADLREADLREAYLLGADLRGASLLGAENIPEREIKKRSIVADGDIVGYKKLSGGVICTLKIPADARRVGGVVGRKCRAEYAIVLDGDGVSSHDRKTEYKVGEKIVPDSFDGNPLIECTHGIHFFITREDAEDY